MNLYLLEQTTNTDYDTFDSCIVAAETEDLAIMTHPDEPDWDGKSEYWDSWCDHNYVNVKFIGEAASGTEPGVILSSFNAG